MNCSGSPDRHPGHGRPRIGVGVGVGVGKVPGVGVGVEVVSGLALRSVLALGLDRIDFPNQLGNGSSCR